MSDASSVSCVPKVQVYTWGLVSASVCAPADMPVAEVESHVNDELPTGIDSPWRKDDSPTFRGGEPNPCVCEHDSSRLHYLLSC